MERVAAVTGANGFIGSHLCTHLRTHGWRVIELRRDAGVDSGPESDRRFFSLTRPIEPDLLTGIELLVHAAYDPRPVRWEAIRRANLEGSLSLFAAAAAAGVRRVVHVSTMSSFEGCRSRYGRVKLETERDALRRGFVVLRPGLVFGAGGGGMVGGLGKIAERSPIVPLIGRGDQRLYAIHVEDLCRVIERVASIPGSIPHPLIVAHDRPWTFRQILKQLARGRHVRFVPVPWRLIWTGLSLLEIAGLRVGFRADSVVSLVHQDPAPDFAPTRVLGVDLRPLALD